MLATSIFSDKKSWVGLSPKDQHRYIKTRDDLIQNHPEEFRKIQITVGRHLDCVHLDRIRYERHWTDITNAFKLYDKLMDSKDDKEIDNILENLYQKEKLDLCRIIGKISNAKAGKLNKLIKRELTSQKDRYQIKKSSLKMEKNIDSGVDSDSDQDIDLKPENQ